MYRLGLNLSKRDNFMFLDFDAPLCLSVTDNVGVAKKLTPSIITAVKFKTLLDLDGSVAAELDRRKAEQEPKKEIVDAPMQVDTSEDDKTIGDILEEEGVSTVSELEDVISEEPKKKRTRKAKTE